VREELEAGGGIFGVKSGFLPEQGWLGLKAGGFWGGNRERGLPAHQSAILLFEPDTGRVQALIDANVVTRLRTGAVGAIAARRLARRAAAVAAVVGCGVQGEVQTRALALVLPALREVRCFDVDAASVEAYRRALRDLDRLEIVPAGTVEEAVRGADVIVTTTPSRRALVMDEWVAPAAHISAIGADTRGKQELDPRLLRRARVVVDDWRQARELGECQHAYRLGWLRDDGAWAELGELCAGLKPGRQGAELTIFDATGLAIQDLAVAGFAVAQARARGAGVEVEL
jgi:ornithine cyclodeaminase